MWNILSFLLGAIVGSFSNVVIYRLPRKELKLWDPPRSFCPNCKHPLSWKDNIPILSYIALKGRCRYCGWRIPYRYLIVELADCIFFGFSSFLINDVLTLIGIWGVFATLVVISFIDMETMEISDALNLTVLGFSILVSWRTDHLIPGLITGSVVFGVFFVVSKFSGGFGMGDVLLLGSASTVMEPVSVNVAILVGAVSALIYSIFKFKGLKLKEAVPFAPFLSIGIITADIHSLFLRGAISWSG